MRVALHLAERLVLCRLVRETRQLEVLVAFRSRPAPAAVLVRTWCLGVVEAVQQLVVTWR